MVPTVEEILAKKFSELPEIDQMDMICMSTNLKTFIINSMKECATLHCKAQSKAIEESAYIVTTRDKYRHITGCKINRESIVTAYPLDKIK